MGVLNVLLLLGGGHLRGLIGMENLQLLHPFLPAPLWIATVVSWGRSILAELLSECGSPWGCAFCHEIYSENLNVILICLVIYPTTYLIIN